MKLHKVKIMKLHKVRDKIEGFKNEIVQAEKNIIEAKKNITDLTEKVENGEHFLRGYLNYKNLGIHSKIRLKQNIKDDLSKLYEGKCRNRTDIIDKVYFFAFKSSFLY